MHCIGVDVSKQELEVSHEMSMIAGVALCGSWSQRVVQRRSRSECVRISSCAWCSAVWRAGTSV